MKSFEREINFELTELFSNNYHNTYLCFQEEYLKYQILTCRKRYRKYEKTYHLLLQTVHEDLTLKYGWGGKSKAFTVKGAK